MRPDAGVVIGDRVATQSTLRAEKARAGEPRDHGPPDDRICYGTGSGRQPSVPSTKASILSEPPQAASVADGVVLPATWNPGRGRLALSASSNPWSCKGNVLTQIRTTRLNPLQLHRRLQIGEERRARTRAKLLDAAYQLFARHGADTPTIDDVLLEAGVSRGTFYNHFRTRDELFEAVGEDITTSIGAIILPAIAEMPDSAARVALAFRIFVRFAVADEARGWILLRTIPLGGALNDEMKSFVQSEFEAAMAEGALRSGSAAAITDLTIGMHIMTIHRLLVERSGDTTIDEAAATLMVALGVPHAKAVRIASDPIPDDLIELCRWMPPDQQPRHVKQNP